jgi:hypothetical protein
MTIIDKNIFENFGIEHFDVTKVKNILQMYDKFIAGSLSWFFCDINHIHI